MTVRTEAYLYADEIQVSLGKKRDYDEEISALSSVLAKVEKTDRPAKLI